MRLTNFVNINGDPITFISEERVKHPKKEQPEEFHNGWRAQGIPPGALEAARDWHRNEVKYAQLHNTKMPKDWDEQHWLMTARRKPVRSKPYEVPEAAQECKALAEKAGWLRVEVLELKKEKGAGKA